MRIRFNTARAEDYQRFLQVRRLPQYHFAGRQAIVPDEYVHLLGHETSGHDGSPYSPHPDLYDYQADITAQAIRKRKFAVFADCGLGKTLIILEFARHAAKATGRPVLIIAPLMVVRQTANEHERFYGGETVRALAASELQDWLNAAPVEVAVTNYEALRDDITATGLGGVVLDESSILKSHYGKWGAKIIEMSRGVPYKLAATGTPAPNDRIEYANHAVFLDRARTVNEFLASYFINRGQTQNRWEIKPHAIGPFYRALSDWSVFLQNPADYGWRDNVDVIPPIRVHVESVPLTAEQRTAAQNVTGDLITARVGGIGTRGKLSRIAKGIDVASRKPEYIREMVQRWPDESVIIWCHYNDEQSRLAELLPEAANIHGSTKYETRLQLLSEFQDGTRRVLVTKPKILGFGVNLQIASRQIFSGLKDSYEEYYQAVKRSNRIGSTKPLDVHIPVTELEEPFLENVLRKADRVENDTREQKRLYKEHGIDWR